MIAGGARRWKEAKCLARDGILVSEVTSRGTIAKAGGRKAL